MGAATVVVVVVGVLSTVSACGNSNEDENGGPGLGDSSGLRVGAGEVSTARLKESVRKASGLIEQHANEGQHTKAP